MVSTPKLPLLVCWFVCSKKVEIVDNFYPLLMLLLQRFLGKVKAVCIVV